MCWADSMQLLAKPRFRFLDVLDWSPMRSRQRQGRLMIVLVLWNRISSAIRHESTSESGESSDLQSPIEKSTYKPFPSAGSTIFSYLTGFMCPGKKRQISSLREVRHHMDGLVKSYGPCKSCIWLRFWKTIESCLAPWHWPYTLGVESPVVGGVAC